eukprot:m.1388126 g.1388126  ORF g.1388126 m.1388126 type:complete len:117 (+) comp24987_c0_seq2:2498-2848(+)
MHSGGRCCRELMFVVSVPQTIAAACKRGAGFVNALASRGIFRHRPQCHVKFFSTLIPNISLFISSAVCKNHAVRTLLHTRAHASASDAPWGSCHCPFSPCFCLVKAGIDGGQWTRA